MDGGRAEARVEGLQLLLHWEGDEAVTATCSLKNHISHVESFLLPRVVNGWHRFQVEHCSWPLTSVKDWHIIRNDIPRGTSFHYTFLWRGTFTGEHPKPWSHSTNTVRNTPHSIMMQVLCLSAQASSFLKLNSMKFFFAALEFWNTQFKLLSRADLPLHLFHIFAKWISLSFFPTASQTKGDVRRCLLQRLSQFSDISETQWFSDYLRISDSLLKVIATGGQMKWKIRISRRNIFDNASAQLNKAHDKDLL